MKAWNLIKTNIQEWLQHLRISYLHAFEKWKQMNKILESEFEYFLSTEERVKYFYYDDNCFSTILKQLLQSSEWSNLYKTPSTKNIGIEISQKETTVRSKEETKETSITPHQSEQLVWNQNDYLIWFINWVWFSGIEGSSQKQGHTSEFRQDESTINQDNLKDQQRLEIALWVITREQWYGYIQIFQKEKNLHQTLIGQWTRKATDKELFHKDMSQITKMKFGYFSNWAEQFEFRRSKLNLQTSEILTLKFTLSQVV